MHYISGNPVIPRAALVCSPDLLIIWKLDADLLLNMAVPLYVRVTFIAMVSVVAEFAPVFFRILDASNTPLPLIRQVAAFNVERDTVKHGTIPDYAVACNIPVKMSTYLWVPPVLAYSFPPLATIRFVQDFVPLLGIVTVWPFWMIALSPCPVQLHQPMYWKLSKNRIVR